MTWTYKRHRTAKQSLVCPDYLLRRTINGCEMAIVRSLTVGLVTFSGGPNPDILVGLMDGADNSINNGLA